MKLSSIALLGYPIPVCTCKLGRQPGGGPAIVETKQKAIMRPNWMVGFLVSHTAAPFSLSLPSLSLLTTHCSVAAVFLCETQPRGGKESRVLLWCSPSQTRFNPPLQTLQFTDHLLCSTVCCTRPVCWVPVSLWPPSDMLKPLTYTLPLPFGLGHPGTSQDSLGQV